MPADNLSTDERHPEDSAFHVFLVNLREKSVRILVIEDDEAHRSMVELAIAKGMAGAEVICRDNGRDASACIADGEYDCVLLDNHLPGISGVEILTQLGELRGDRPMPPVIILTGTGDEAVAVAAMKAGAADYIRKDELEAPLLCHAIRSAVKQHEQAIKLLEHQKMLAELAFTDALTGLGNRAAFDHEALRYLARASRRADSLAMLVIDMNGLKRINDEMGHQAGDMMIKSFARRLDFTMRQSDAAFRLGGDEFVALIEYTINDEPLEQIISRIAGNLRGHLAFENIEIEYSASVGVACFPTDGHTLEALFSRADEAMYRSKRNGTSYEFSGAAARPLPA